MQMACYVGNTMPIKAMIVVSQILRENRELLLRKRIFKNCDAREQD